MKVFSIMEEYMSSRLPELKFFSGRSNLQLANNITNADGFKISETTFTDFANGELKIKLNESVRGDDVYILQTAAPPLPDKWMMELLIMAHTAYRASARRITAVIPYIYGSRQDRKTEPRTPLTIQLMGDLLSAAGVKRIITVSLHNNASEAAFGKILVDNLSSTSIFYPYVKKYVESEETIIMSPDAGGVQRAKIYADHFSSDLGFCYKTRPKANVAATLAFVGDVKDKQVLIVDDIIDTAGTLCNIAREAKERGEKKIAVVATHAILSGNAVEKIASAPIDNIYISDSIYHENLPNTFNVLSLGKLLCNTILAVNGDKSVGDLFERENIK